MHYYVFTQSHRYHVKGCPVNIQEETAGEGLLALPREICV